MKQKRNGDGTWAKKKVDYDKPIKSDLIKGTDGNMYFAQRKLKAKTQYFLIGRNRNGEMTEVEVNWTPNELVS
jgi:hypothetical protein